MDAIKFFAAVEAKWPEEQHNYLTVHAYADPDDPGALAKAKATFEKEACCGKDEAVITVDGKPFWVGVSFGH